jgi:arylsulfatase A-like enzyme
MEATMTTPQPTPQTARKVGRTMAESEPWFETEPAAPAGAPNVVFCVFDDVGFSDFGCYGSEISTPNIDRLANGGIRFTNFHTTSLCSPTRASLLTGRHHHAVGMGSLANFDHGFPGYRGRISKNAALLPEMLRPQGYNSFAVGKWHLTPMHEVGPSGPFDHWPTQRGFDRFYGFVDGAMNQWEPFLTEDNHHVATPDTPGYHLTDDLVSKTIRLITDQSSVTPDKPFFAYLAFGAGHSPHHVTKDRIDAYVPLFEKGWDVTRDERLVKQKLMGIVPQNTQLPPRNPGVRAWSSIPAEEQALFVRFQAAYAAMLTHTDEQIGKLLDSLESLGRLQNTLFVLMSDNGASQEGSQVGTMHQGSYFEGAPIGIDHALAHMDEIGETQWFNNYPLGWAMAGNTPCKFYKQNTHGGGVRDPFILHFPARFADQAGTLRHQFHHVTDVVPTVLQMIGLDAPTIVNGTAQLPIHGTSMVYALRNTEAPTEKRVQHFEMLGHRGIVADGWKAVTIHQPRTTLDQDVWELYNLNEDFSEFYDLAAEHPEKLRELTERWWGQAGLYQVLPVDDGGGAKRMKRPVRTSWTLWPGTERIPLDVAPQTANTNHTITAYISVPEGGCSGAIISAGDRWGGYVMYLDNRVPVFHYHFPIQRSEARGPSPLSPGDHTITWTLTKNATKGGTGVLSVDGVEAATVELERIVRGWAAFGGMDVGCDNGAPVGLGYESPFRFTGTIDRVEVELLGRVGPNPTVAMRTEMGKQ